MGDEVHEVGGDAVVYADDPEPRSIARAVCNLLDHDSVRVDLGRRARESACAERPPTRVRLDSLAVFEPAREKQPEWCNLKNCGAE